MYICFIYFFALSYPNLQCKVCERGKVLYWFLGRSGGYIIISNQNSFARSALPKNQRKNQFPPTKTYQKSFVQDSWYLFILKDLLLSTLSWHVGHDTCFSQVIDYGNRAQDVERAVFEFSRPRRVLATDTDVVVRLSAELKVGRVWRWWGLNLWWTRNSLFRFVVWCCVYIHVYLHLHTLYLQRCILLLDTLNWFQSGCAHFTGFSFYSTRLEAADKQSQSL